MRPCSCARLATGSLRVRKGTAAGETCEKIAAIGVRLTRWVSSHGIAINVAPNLADFSGIVPCGISDAGVTSLAAQGRATRMNEVDRVLRATFERRFGATVDAG